ncbi:MAG: hypothetical protein OIF47_00510 [Marinibacterium sp.]|nr:hypothetical protein [Marinibacterium sp.]
MSGGAHQTALLYHLGRTCQTIDELRTTLEMNSRQISDAASGLIQRGFVERVEAGCFQLTAEGHTAVANGERITSGPNGPHKSQRSPRQNTLRQRAWSAMRIRRRFSIPDLITDTALGDERGAANNLQRYVRSLRKAQVIRCLPVRVPGTAPSSPGFPQYTLVHDLGPVAPTLRRNGLVLFDHNSGQEIGL